MALTIKNGDLLSEVMGTKCLIVHGCNAQGVMGSGFAALIKKRYPHAYLTYQQAKRRNGLKLGNVSVWWDADGGPSVANAVTQEFYGREFGRVYVSYDAVIVAMQSIVRFIDENHPGTPIHFPLIGGGLGGGDRLRLIAIFEAVFAEHDATLWLLDE